MIIRNKDTGFTGRDIPSMKFPANAFFCECRPSRHFCDGAAYRRWGGYDVKFRYMMDHDFLARAYQGWARFKYVPADLAEFRLGGVSVLLYLQRDMTLSTLY